ncbi:hypothetical protein Pint_20649 [Pistacia integerrima]|uniref:Uncharacterized protein n=1 Tax=Pistacia integerrima TaxID=434235 RepID=A0ACC0XCN0_9ROSI|nr:hypothetical protein Pint_20649 [Pistacia integerrima]
MKYLRGTSKLRLYFGSGKPVLVGYTNANMSRDMDSRKSTFGYMVTFVGEVLVVKIAKQKWYVLFCDNWSVIHLVKNSTFHLRCNHINVRYHWIRDTLSDRCLFELEKIHTDDNCSNMLTKGFSKGEI